MKSTMVRAGLVAFVIGAIAGCGGDGGGGGGDAGVVAPVVPAGPTLTAAPVPTGTADITVGSLSADQFGALAPTVVVGGALVGSPPQVSFALQDANGNPIIGFGSTSQSATATLKSYPNLAFSIAKLVPGTNGSPSKWVSYIVTTVPTKNATTGAITDAAPTRPSTDNTGTLVDNGNGTYTYTFYRDITKIKDQVAAMTVTAPNNTADLGDLTYDANAVHRLTIAVYGNAPGTGTNTADGVQVTAGVPMKNPVNVVYDFIPATGKAVTETDPGRNIVATAKCNECHGKLGGTPGDLASSQPAAFHGSARNNTQYCVVCHTDQRRYGRVEATFDTATNSFVKPASGCSASASNPDPTCTYVVDGRTVGNFPNYIHKVHLAHYLTKDKYDYAGVHFNHITYPQPIKNCTKCHDGSDTSTSKTAQGDNWKNVPSRLACGACHDGINFATGKGVTLADAREGLTTSQYGHIGGIQADDSKCALCHSPAAMPVYHVTIDPTGSSGRAGYPVNTATDTPTVGFPSGQGPSIPLASQVGTLPEGVYKINFEIKQVTVAGAAGAKKATVVYRILKDGQPVTLNATGSLITGVDGSPGVYVAYATTQDGIANPADWNVSKNASVKAIRDGTIVSGSSSACPVACTQTGPDASGFYTAALSVTIPDDAKLVTAAVGVDYQGFVQLNHADFPKGIRLREPKFVMKVADGFTARRSIVDADKCNACHGQLGVSPSFHGGARNNGEGCAICHDANRATGHTGPTNNFGGGWSVQVKNLVHGIHAASKREQAFTYEATAENLEGFGEVTFPGILKKCETCHVPGSYDFSGTANSAALPNLLWTTDAKGNMLNDATTNPTGITPIGLSPWVTTQGQGQIDYRTNNLVSSPIASSCFGCHDSSLAVQHMESNGGTLVRLFSSVSSIATRPAVGTTSTMTFTKTEQCTLCHLTGRVADIKVMHAK